MKKNEREKKRREYLKKVNRCVRCMKMDAYTMNGRACCFECTEKQKKFNMVYREKNRALISEKSKKMREKWREDNLCTHCGKELPKKYSWLECSNCRAKKRIAAEKIRKKVS